MSGNENSSYQGRGGRSGGRSSAGGRGGRSSGRGGGGRFNDGNDGAQKREHGTQRGPNPPHKRRESEEGRERGGRGGGQGERVRLNVGSQRTLNEAQPAKNVKDGGNVPTTMAFASMGLSKQSMRAITEVCKFTHATAVQDQTLPHITKGVDVLARAKTGSGKTVGFTLPSIELLMKNPETRKGDVSVLIVSPTRELASQIHVEANQLLTFHEYGAQVVFGGTNIGTDKKRLRENRCDFLVATPGRLIDHLENEGLRERMSNLRVLVLDEADQLLEMGFRPSIEKILSYLPRNRQTLLFSATVPDAVKQIAANAMSDNHVYIDCVGDEATATNSQVAQWLTVADTKDHLALLLQVVEAHAREVPNHKIMCFFPTARATGLASEVFEAMGIKVFEIHSRKSQSARTKAADQFRASKSAVMMSSDVTARGMDFPDVTFVIQIGLPSSREQYVHRLGRTGRAGKTGEGLLILADFEKYILRSMKDLPLQVAEASVDPNASDRINRALQKVDSKTKDQAYVAWMGFYNSNTGKIGWSKNDLVHAANSYAIDVLGCPGLPGVLAKTVGMMGLREQRPLLNVVSQLDGGGGGGGGRGGGRGRGGRR
ncbi:unnamed protein product [Bathycoccus prasinos]